MRVIIQRVKKAELFINENVFSSISQGLVVLVGIEENDTKDDAEWLAQKITALRIFEDEDGKMNKDLNEINGHLMIVSQFTLHASTKKGNRPSFIKAAKPDIAKPLYEYFILQMQNRCKNQVKTGQFGAFMEINLINNGPVTIFIDSKNKE
ncbi:MAG: D-tyrosyl-tRNA(Tyr) deacylase [Sphingobacteriaceae bacterium]|nr:D-tyrosyl-tRNA(Tyr) deacylase [Sphingobacteriaceae bacterium]